MTTLNLDSMPANELWQLYNEFYRHIRLTSKKYGLSVRDGKLYMAYASNKAVAIKLRLECDENCLKYENICNDIYTRMTVKQW